MSDRAFVCPRCKRTLPKTPGRWRAVKLDGAQLCIECSRGKSPRDRVVSGTGLLALAVVSIVFWGLVGATFFALEAAGLIEIGDGGPCTPADAMLGSVGPECFEPWFDPDLEP